jgi:uncharacterized protein involved in type VI secretion and phage assembly
MAKLTDMMGRPHSGTLPVAVVAVVTDNVDPEELGRIQVKFPTLHQEPVSFWLRQASPNGGKERGLYALPEIDDEVLVLFMQGSQDVGVIIGQFWNGVDKPPTEAKDGMPVPGDSEIPGAKKSSESHNDGSKSIEKNDRRFWRSRSGHLLVFDDTDGAETVQIWDKSHTLCLTFDSADSRIVLANSKGDIHIRTAQDLYLEAGRDLIWHASRNIEGESVQDTTHTVGKDYTVDVAMNAKMTTGQNFDIEAGMNLTAKASMNASIEGSMNFDAKGGIQAKMEGSAMAVVKGGMVMIN